MYHRAYTTFALNCVTVTAHWSVKSTELRVLYVLIKSKLIVITRVYNNYAHHNFLMRLCIFFCFPLETCKSKCGWNTICLIWSLSVSVYTFIFYHLRFGREIVMKKLQLRTFCVYWLFIGRRIVRLLRVHNSRKKSSYWISFLFTLHSILLLRSRHHKPHTHRH